MSFLDALKERAGERPQSVTHDVAPIIEQETEDQAECVVNVRLIANKGRIDLYFSTKPEKWIRDNLKKNRWGWNDAEKCWFHKDSPENRAYLNEMFDCALEIPESPQIEVSEEIETPSYRKYKRQVGELLEHTGLDAADLMLAAIDCLHKQEFSRDS